MRRAVRGTRDAPLGGVKLATQLSVMALAGLALGAETAYAPRGATGWQARYRAAVVELPAANPHGTIEIASFGLVGLAPENSPPMTALHVRLVVHNASDEAAWSIALDTVTLELGAARLHPTLINSDLGTLPIAIIDRTVTESADLFFALPAGAAGPKEFSLAWEVATPAGPIAQRTSFVPDTAPPPPRSDGTALGRGRRWWADPTYPWPNYQHHSGPLASKPPTFVFVTRPPQRH